MNYKCIFRWLILYALLTTECTDSPKYGALPRSTPESEGVSSENILKFIDAVENSNNEFHSFMFLRHGKVIAEGWWKPYRSEFKHTMYSVSKSWTSTAIGFAVQEDLLDVEDKVISFFPDELPDTISPYLEEMRVKHLLSMSTGQKTIAIPNLGNDKSWIKIFLENPVVFEPGSRFQYNSLATYMLSAIIQKLTGEKVIDYLRPRLFEPLGIKDVDWEEDPQGINKGGWGLRVRTEAMAKLGQLYLQKGMWNGKQILNEEWIEEASSKHIDQAPELSQAQKDLSDWTQGYGYQFWRCRHNAYRADGAFGQFIIVLPEQDAVIAITSETIGGKDAGMQNELNLIWKYLYPSFSEEILSDNSSTESLHRRLDALSLELPGGKTDPALFSKIEGKSYANKTGEFKIEKISFEYEDEVCYLNLQDEESNYRFPFGTNSWIDGEINIGVKYFSSGQALLQDDLTNYKISGACSWEDENTLKLLVRYTESPHTFKMFCFFDQDNIEIKYRISSNPGMSLTGFKGKLIE
jgi:CubicO group peptidase (beta-lactamase class C family)